MKTFKATLVALLFALCATGVFLGKESVPKAEAKCKKMDIRGPVCWSKGDHCLKGSDCNYE